MSDAALHAAVAAPAMVALVLSGMSPGVAAAWNAALWFARELDQTGWAANPLKWSTPKHAEWLAPAAASVVLAFIFTTYSTL